MALDLTIVGQAALVAATEAVKRFAAILLVKGATAALEWAHKKLNQKAK